VWRYIDAVRAEIEAARASGMLRGASSVYLGGGTPSLVGADALAALLGSIDPVPGAEVSVECNPTSTTPELLDGLLAAGVTRISLGVQSLSAKVLASLGRDEPPEDSLAALGAIAKAGFSTFSVDLVYGAAAETDEDFEHSLSTLLGLAVPPPHVSCYALTVEPGTALARDRARHPDDDVSATRYGIADALLGAAGYEWYEISNFALDGHRCRHNMAYWDEGDYLGFGCAAHSHVGSRRFSNVVDIGRYLSRVEGGASAVARTEELSGAARELEALELSLRTSAGVPLEALEVGGIEHLVSLEDGRAVLNVAGRMLADEVALRLHGRPREAD